MPSTRFKISPNVGHAPKQNIFKNKDPYQSFNLSKLFFQKTKLAIPTKTIEDFEINDFISFGVIEGEITVKLFGVFKVVSNDIFFLEKCRMIENVPKGSIYQIQEDSNGRFLQGIPKGFNYSFNM